MSEEIERLEKRIAELEAKVNPEPKAPFVAPPYQLRPLAEFLSGKPSADPPKAEAGTVPRDGKVPGQDLMDAIARGFADRERAEELAKLVDVANKLRGL